MFFPAADLLGQASREVGVGRAISVGRKSRKEGERTTRTEITRETRRRGCPKRKLYPFKSKWDIAVREKGEEGEKKEELKKKRKKETGREEGEWAIKKER